MVGGGVKRHYCYGFEPSWDLILHSAPMTEGLVTMYTIIGFVYVKQNYTKIHTDFLSASTGS